MTARERLNRRMRWIGGAMYAGMVFFMANVLIGVIFVEEPVQPVLAIAVGGLAIAILAGTTASFSLLGCPWCRGNLASLILQQGWLSVNARVCYCPYCGRGLDEEFAPADPAKVRGRP